MKVDRYDELDVDAIMDQVRQQQEEVERIQGDVEAMLVKGHSRQQEVTASVRGTGRFTEISVDPERIRGLDAYELGGVVLEAVNDALDKLAAATAARYAPVIEAASRMAEH